MSSLGTGRSGSGRLRNFKAMSNEKLGNVYWAVIMEADDAEAIAAYAGEMASRGLPLGTDALDADEAYEDGDFE